VVRISVIARRFVLKPTWQSGWRVDVDVCISVINDTASTRLPRSAGTLRSQWQSCYKIN